MSDHNRKHHKHDHSAAQRIVVTGGEDVQENGVTPSDEMETQACDPEERAIEVECEEAEKSEPVTDTVEPSDEDPEATDDHVETAKPEEKPDASKTDWRDAYVRLAADFDNYRKRMSKEHEDVRRRERERVVGIWLDVYDNAERALASLPEKEGPWYEGFASLIQQMDKCLAALNIKPADDLGKPFDPKRHEAIAACPNPNMPNNTIMHVERRGFVYDNGDVARVARVIVVRNPS